MLSIYLSVRGQIGLAPMSARRRRHTRSAVTPCLRIIMDVADVQSGAAQHPSASESRHCSDAMHGADGGAPCAPASVVCPSLRLARAQTAQALIMIHSIQSTIHNTYYTSYKAIFGVLLIPDFVQQRSTFIAAMCCAGTGTAAVKKEALQHKG
jgi:hypothetical protein